MKQAIFYVLALIAQSPFSFSQVTVEEKKARIHFIEQIGEVAPSVSVDSYRRELQYEILNLSLEERAKREASLLAEKIKDQLIMSYQMSLEETQSPRISKEIILQQVSRDLEFADPELKTELYNLCEETLNQIQLQAIYNNQDLKSLAIKLLPEIKSRSKYLNHLEENRHQKNLDPSTIESYDDTIKVEYESKDELLKSLVSSNLSSRELIIANQMIKSSQISRKSTSISLQVKIDFMGVEIEAGPVLSFSREFSTNVTLMAEELNPILLENGLFDTIRRDEFGKPLLKNDKLQRRFLTFTCEAHLIFSSENLFGGGLRVLGAGAGTNVTSSYTSEVSINSRRAFVPDYVGKKAVTIKFLNELCHDDFLKAKINKSISVADSLNLIMKNTVANLKYSHSLTKCALDTHCIDWFNREVPPLFKLKTYPRCVEEKREKYRTCLLRGLEGNSCKVYENGKLTSSGLWEYECDKGLKCVKYQNATWWRNSKGKCHPIDPKSYKDPIKYPEYATEDSYIIIDLIEN
jgi:hypothetical protein